MTSQLICIRRSNQIDFPFLIQDKIHNCNDNYEDQFHFPVWGNMRDEKSDHIWNF